MKSIKKKPCKMKRVLMAAIAAISERPWGASLGYRYLGSDALIMTSIVNGSEKPGMKGLEASLWFHLGKNIQLQNYFFNGSPIAGDSRANYNRTAYFSSLIFAF